VSHVNVATSNQAPKKEDQVGVFSCLLLQRMTE
jgi:hypothetical protein